MAANNINVSVYYRNQNDNKNVGSQSYTWANHPQSNAMAAGALLFISGGMNLAMGLGWNDSFENATTMQFQFCWFATAIAGAILSAPLISILEKRVLMLISALFVLASGIIFTSVPYNYAAIIAARYVNGFGIGFALVPFVVHGSELAMPSYRGSCLTIEQYATTLGVAIQVIYSSQWTIFVDFASNRLHGIISIVCAVVALGSCLVMIESPVFYLRRCDENAALESIRRQQRPQVITNAKKAYMEEVKSYVVEEDNRPVGESLRRSLLPYIKVAMFRGLLALTVSLPLNLIIVWSSFVSLGYSRGWPLIVYAVLRFFGSFIGIWLVDGLGRKLISLFSLACMGGLYIGVGAITSYASNLISSYKMSIVVALVLIMQFFAGLYTPAASTYLGEAFPMVMKPYFIALCVGIEYAIHIITVCLFVFSSSNMFTYCIAVGVIMLVLTVVFAIIMPETRKTTLTEAQNRFRHLIYLRAY